MKWPLSCLLSQRTYAWKPGNLSTNSLVAGSEGLLGAVVLSCQWCVRVLVDMSMWGHLKTPQINPSHFEDRKNFICAFTAPQCYRGLSFSTLKLQSTSPPAAIKQGGEQLVKNQTCPENGRV